MMKTISEVIKSINSELEDCIENYTILGRLPARTTMNQTLEKCINDNICDYELSFVIDSNDAEFITRESRTYKEKILDLTYNI